MRLQQYLDNLTAKGRYVFNSQEAGQALNCSPIALRSALRRMRQKRIIASPVRGIHVIIPPEYREIGFLPPEYAMHDIMHYLGSPYYIALLSAAQFYGAAHQQPQRFYVVTDKARFPIKCGKAHIIFVVRRNMQELPTQPFNTPYGVVEVSSPEVTAIDLVTYPYYCLGISYIITVLNELAESIEPKRFGELVGKVSDVTWLQRLGFLYETLGNNPISQQLEQHLAKVRVQPCALELGSPTSQAKLDKKWNVLINCELELEI
jgi:predicted transcriptional regulator of viral defense system